MNVSWTDMAQADLEAIEAHIGRSSEEAARAMLGRVLVCVARLKLFPMSGPILSKDEDETRSTREVFEAPYRIIYRIRDADDEVQILRVVHSARHLPRGLFGAN